MALTCNWYVPLFKSSVNAPSLSALVPVELFNTEMVANAMASPDWDLILPFIVCAKLPDAQRQSRMPILILNLILRFNSKENEPFLGRIQHTPTAQAEGRYASTQLN